MVVVGMRDDDRVEMNHALPREGRAQKRVIGSGVDEDRPPFASKQKRVSLAHIEHDELRPPCKGADRDRHCESECEDGASRSDPPWTNAPAGTWPGDPQRAGKRERRCEADRGVERYGQAGIREGCAPRDERAQCARATRRGIDQAPA